MRIKLFQRFFQSEPAALPGPALTTVDERRENWFKWNTGEFAATLRYLHYGTATPGINETYAREVKHFIRADQVMIGMIRPPETKGAVGDNFIFWGARLFPLPNQKGAPSFLALSYLGSANHLHRSQSFDALLSAETLEQAVSSSLVQLERPLGLLEQVDEAILTNACGWYTPLSFNSGDVDGDGKDDFVFGGRLILSASGYDVSAAIDMQAEETVFFQSEDGPRLATLQGNTLCVYCLREGSLFLVSALQVSPTTVSVPYRLFVLPKRGKDTLALLSDTGLAIIDFVNGKLGQRAMIAGLPEGPIYFGGRGQFLSDTDDIWLSCPAHGCSPAEERDRIYLLSGARLAMLKGDSTLSDLIAFEITGSSRYSDYDGIATTMSPIAGDIDGDGRPDFTFSGHRHMSEAGALYVLLGKDITEGGRIVLTDNRIIKVVGPMMAQLAPPFHHWDATDLDGDGCDEIVISADNDVASGIHAGAVYILSGRKITERLHGNEAFSSP